MVSVFPPNYALTPIFNVSDNVIIEILKNGYSEKFYKKCLKLYERYENSLGIDEHEIPFIKNLKRRIKEIEKRDGKIIDFKTELNKYILFLKDVIDKKEHYFIDYIKTGRAIRDKELYKKHKLKSITYTPNGTFYNRENKSFIKSSKLLYFDIDVPTTRDEKRKLISFFLSEKYIRTSWFSFSGKGFAFWVESDWETEKQMKKNYYKLLEYFTLTLKHQYGFNKKMFDTQVASLSRMNIISYGLIKHKKKGEYEIFKTIDYSDDLYDLLRLYYKKNSTKKIPENFLKENIIKRKKKKNFNNIVYKDVFSFLEQKTKNLSFIGHDDYNTAIKEFMTRVFRFDIEDSVLEEFIFNKIPYNTRTEKTFNSLLKSYSRYSGFKSIKLNL